MDTQVLFRLTCWFPGSGALLDSGSACSSTLLAQKDNIGEASCSWIQLSVWFTHLCNRNNWQLTKMIIALVPFRLVAGFNYLRNRCLHGGTEDRASRQDDASSQQIRGVCDHWDKIRSSSLTAFTDSECGTTPQKWHCKPPNTGRKEMGSEAEWMQPRLIWSCTSKICSDEWFKRPACSLLPPAVAPTPQSFWLSITAACQ